jgi:glycosyltransferase involved in cell wall biosynthesis
VVPGRKQALLRPWWETVTLPAALSGESLDVFFSPYGAVPPLSCPVVATLHDLAFLEEPGLLSWRHAPYWRWTARRLRLASTVLAVSEATREVALRRLRLAPDRVVAIPNGVDARFRAASAEQVSALRTRLDLHGDFVLAVAPWQPRKNLSTLAQAVARAGAQRGRPLPLVIVGRPDAAQQRRYPHVVAVGTVDDATLIALLSAATVFALPSLDEGFGLTLIEAMACGAPCIASHAGALPEVAAGAALLLPPQDVDAWTAAIARLLTQPAQGADLRRRSLARAAAFSWQETARRTLAAIEAAAVTRHTI